ncbi:lysophospholipid acyltransferase family protein [Paractinoplanes durhamensis]|uniref:1-acyl-sn-glycerol-3-phosphate acyltransferase n=1 Tax=Paractinoplanes durhamensis TaxID=113563 RepID=A0ABQ3ZA21_9ACTN|nr:lysophospholipid acyltransferase family protein [Actinoplanes durhamensis]GIE06688.1 1-acyl-sn-glycerol-3-phosphate acyltransferase [Actinoplanes durhamensis]
MLAETLRTLLRPVSQVVFRPEVHGSDNVPRTGPVIVAANHLSFVDSFIVPLTAPRRVSFIAKQEYFDHGGAKQWVTRNFLTGIDAIPVSRGGFRAAQESLEVALKLLKDGGAFGIHPEGSRSRDGRLYRGRTGVAWLAIASGAPVIPVALIGTEKIQPVGASFPKPGKVIVHFGKPLVFTPPADGKQGPARRKATDEIMAAIAALSGQEVANEFNELSAG